MDTLLARLRRALEGRYALEQELGRGGMAIVWLGRDLRLDRRVAIKVFERDGGLLSAGERFLREIRIAAQLQHPNILPVHDSGEGEGLVYYVMPYVAGGSVRERLKREGPLPVPDAVRIAREVAEALDHAHRAGIIHRDIKPDNIMLADGVAVVADFGIARAIEQGGATVTDTGLAIGTPNYMSPEQAAASPQVDGRTDVYALGCVLYEMLAGTPPFTGTTAQQVMARHATDAAPPLRTVRQVPAPLEQAITRALAKLPADRWPTGRAFADALGSGSAAAPVTPRESRRVSRHALAAAAVLLIVGAAVAAKWAIWPPPPAAEPSIAVLPFTLLGDSANSHLAGGLTEAVTTGLVRSGDLRVSGHGTAARYADPNRDAVAVGKELRVDHVLTASILTRGDTLRLTAQLIRVLDARQIWSEHFDGSLVDIFSMQNAITARIVQALHLKLAPGRQTARTRARDPEAYQLYFRGQEALRRASLEGAEQGARYFSQALERDSAFADAWLGLAESLDWMTQFSGRAPVELFARFRSAVERAMELDSAHPRVIKLRARQLLNLEWDLDGYLREAERGLRLYPQDASLHFMYGQDLHIFGLRDSALKVLRRAHDLDPADAFLVANVADALVVLGRTEEARAWVQRALTMDSTQWLPYLDLAIIASRESRHDDAARDIGRAHRILGDIPWILPYVIRCSKVAQPAVAVAAMDRLVELARRQYVQQIFLAHGWMHSGDRSRALAALEAAFHARDRDLISKLGFGEFEALRDEPRYEAILRNTGLDRYLRSPDRVSTRGANLVTC